MTWAQMEFDHEFHERTGIVQISASEDVIEALEDNQVKLEHTPSRAEPDGRGFKYIIICRHLVETLLATS